MKLDNFTIGMLIMTPSFFIYPFASDNIFLYVLGLPFTITALFFIIRSTRSQKLREVAEK